MGDVRSRSGDTAQFQRSAEHITYVDQAIRAREGMAPDAAYVAYDIDGRRSIPAICCAIPAPARNIAVSQMRVRRSAQMPRRIATSSLKWTPAIDVCW
jgi:hypothetical protein